MSLAMGAFKRLVSSIFRRPAKNWNVENRAQTLIDKQEKGQKPAMAPKHDSHVDPISSQDLTEQQNIRTKLKEKDGGLDQMLQGMIVSPEKVGEITTKERPLPEDRQNVPNHEYGYLEPSVVPPGRCSIKQALEFIVAHQTDPKDFTAGKVASTYKLDKGQVQQVLHYFQTLQIRMPKGSMDKAQLKARPSAKTLLSGSKDKPS